MKMFSKINLIFTKEMFKKIWLKIVANQLSHPSGILAKIAAKKMNQSNLLQYRLILENIKLNNNDKVLEIGFGNGKHFQELSLKAENLEITGVDISHEMVAEAVRINHKLHVSGGMKVEVASSDNLPFENSVFDTILCINVIYFWKDPVNHLKEIYRVLKPGGYFYIGFRPKESMQMLSFTEYGFTLYSEDELVYMLRKNNFPLTKSVSQTNKMQELKINKPNLKSICLICQKNYL